MLIACIQTNPQADLQVNLNFIDEMIAKAVANKAEAIVLPEVFTYMGNNAGKISCASFMAEDIFLWLQNLAKKHAVNIIGGSHYEKVPTSEKVYNTLCVFNFKGELIHSYRKIHLFNLRDAQGNSLFCEEDVHLAGDKINCFTLTTKSGEVWRAIAGICYDVRFPELFRQAETLVQPFDVMFLPAAFVHSTGEKHWHTLLKSRAIENLSFVVACNQTGYFAQETKRNYGHSLIVNPWGEVTAELGEEVGILYSEILLHEVQAARVKLPVLQDRKKELIP